MKGTPLSSCNVHAPLLKSQPLIEHGNRIKLIKLRFTPSSGMFIR